MYLIGNCSGPQTHRRLLGNGNEEAGSRFPQQGTIPSPTAEEFKFATKGRLPDLILHSFNVTNLIIKPRLLMAWIKVGNVTRPGRPITGRAQGLRSPSARGARAGLGQPTAGHGRAISSPLQLASLPPRHGTLSLKGFGPACATAHVPHSHASARA